MDLPDRLQALAGRTASSSAAEWRPRLFDLSQAADAAALEGLLRERGDGLSVHDTVGPQLAELVASRAPGVRLGQPERDLHVRAVLGGLRPEQYGRWVYYPWSGRLVHVLPPEDFRALRGDRNRYKITPQEQDRLRSFRIGIVGLSVGQSVALTMALEGVGGSFLLADFDTLGLSNLNRLRAGVADLGLNKAVLAARQMFELDPYLDVRIFPEGITEDNLLPFFSEGGRTIDLLVEECDDLFAKVRLREEARRLRVPVLMDTNDRGLLDVERFDREPDRPLLHGLIGGVRAADLKGLSTRDKVPFVLKILDPSRLSPQILASLVEINETLETWPQLGSAVTLGGALTADVARRLLLGQFTTSGRFYVDLESLVRDGAAVDLAVPAPEEPPAPESLRPSPPVPRPSRQVGAAASPSTEEVRYVVAHGLLAPSGGNAQPWRFLWSDGRLSAYLDPGRATTLLDFRRCASHLAFGAAAENMDLAARDLGLRADVEPFPDAADPLLVFRLGLAADPSVTPEPGLFEQIRLRVTNRRLGPRQPLGDADRIALEAAARARGANLDLVVRLEALDRIADVLGRGDRLRFLTERLHRELMGEIRWTAAEAATTRDGIDVATLEASAADLAALRVLARWPALAYLRHVGGGRALEQSARKAIAAASAAGLLITTGAGPESYFQGGRAVQRLWLTASGLGLSLQPMTVLPYLFARVEQGGGEGLTAEECEALTRLREKYLNCFRVPVGGAEVMLFRLARAAPPTARSLRRPIDEVLTFA